MKNKYSSIFILFALLSMYEVTSAQAPNIGSNSSFALFTATGAFGNMGDIMIWGDVGTNVGAYTGSATVIGNIHVADSVSANAAQDLMPAYNYMLSLACDSIIVTPFGDELKLLAGKVYCITSAAALNGNLVLDAKGDANGIFIIKVNGALTTNTNSNVMLINSASACNVFWQVVGAVDLGINSTFKGTILADGAISLLYDASLVGRALTLAGAISLNNNYVVGCDTLGVPLPIELMSFKAKTVGDNIQLNWSTATEMNNDFFTIQRSKDALTFREVIRVQGSGNSSVVLNYMAIDERPFYGNSYYKLKQTDFDGNRKYSDMIVVNFKKPLLFTVYPNPFSATISVLIDDISLNTNDLEFKIYNTLGKEMMSTILTEPLSTHATGHLFKGIYIYKVISNSEILQSGCIISK